MEPSEIKALRKKLDLNQTDFGRTIGVGLRSVQNYEKGNTKPSADILLNLQKLYADSFANQETVIAHSIRDTETITEPGRNNKEEDPENFITKAGSIYTELSGGKYLLTVPMVPVRAQATYVSEHTDAEFISGLKKISFVVDRVGNGNYQAFEVQNDSMNDGSINSIPDGAMVLGRELGKQHWKNKFKTNQFPYWIIVHKNTVLCKEIAEHDVERGTIICHSLNDSPEYPDFELRLDDIHQLFNIIKKQI